MNLTLLQQTYAVVKLDPVQEIPGWALRKAEKELVSITYTKDELSIVCCEADVPATVQLQHVEKPWKCLKVEGPLDFGLTGILSSLTSPLAEAGISIFAISTYNTDYLIIKENKINQAIEVLKNQGHNVQ